MPHPKETSPCFKKPAPCKTRSTTVVSRARALLVGVFEPSFRQRTRPANRVGAVKVGPVTVDGTKVKANGSKHKAMSYGRMEKKQQQLREEVNQLLEQAEAADEEEDRGP